MWWRYTTLGVALVVFSWTAEVARAQTATGEQLARAVYSRYFGRMPDQGAIDGWSDQLRRGTDPVDLEAEFLGNGEYYQRAGADPGGFVRALYRDMLGISNPDPRDVRAWARFLNRGGADSGARATVAREFIRQTGAGVVLNYFPRTRRLPLPPERGPERRPEDPRPRHDRDVPPPPPYPRDDDR